MPHKSELEGAGYVASVSKLKRESQMLAQFAFPVLFNLGSLVQELVPPTAKMNLPT